MFCGNPKAGGIGLTEGVLHSFSKEWMGYYVLDARNAKINGTHLSGEIGL